MTELAAADVVDADLLYIDDISVTTSKKITVASLRSALNVLAQSAVAVSCPADTTEDVLATITVPANALGANGRLRIRTWWVMTNGADDKITRIRYSGAAGTQYAVNTFTTTTSAMYEADIANVNATDSQAGNSFGVTAGSSVVTVAPFGATVTSVVDTTAATTIVISGQKETAGNTLTLASYMVEIYPRG